jgi:Heparinase II/III-like protein/Heparinase II/III N-terminus
MKDLGKKWARFSQMDWEERRIRLAQEAHKRIDLALYRAGLLSRRIVTRRPILSGGNFFFSQADIPGLVLLFKEKMGGEAESVVREADEICRHRFHLLGYDDLDYGTQIEWNLDAVHGKRAPNKPWFKINSLDFDEVGDHKVIWELNRHQHLVTLAKAWLLTRDERYTSELKSQWYSWQLANPYPIGINWGSSLEVAFRSLSWLWALSLLSDSPALDARFRSDMIRALALNGRHIERNLSTYFSPNTHLLGEAVALFFIGVMCPEIAAADRWRNDGWRIVLREAQRQVRADGVYFEQSLYYHVYALDFFLHARILAGRNGVGVPADFDAVLKKMLDVLSAVSQAAEGFGDDDGGRVFNPRRNRSEHMTDPLALGAILFRRDDLKPVSSLTEEAIWLFGEQGVSYLDKPETNFRKIEPASFDEGGIYVMASGNEVPMQMIIDAGPQGTARSGHGHADALSVTVAIGGHRWLVDPGSFCYSCGERDRFRGTGAHNTLRVDGVDQAIPNGPFAWKSIPEVRCEQWVKGKSFTLFAGSHTGYMRLPDPVLHRRYIFHLNQEFWLIRDVVEGRDKHQIEINWHFASGLALEKIASGFIVTRNVLSPADDRAFDCLALLPVAETDWHSTIEPDFVSPAYGRKDPASTVRSSNRVKLPTEHATLLLPFATPKRIGKLSLLKPADENNPLSVYCYEGQGIKHYIIFADDQTDAWTWNEWVSDARFLYFSVLDGRVMRLLFCDGREVRRNGIPVVVHSRKIERLEWNRSTGEVVSDDVAVHSISTECLESFSPA